ASPDPMTPPAIHMNYLATETDCQTLVAGIRIARRIAEFEPLKSLVTAEHAPGPGVDDSDGAILDWARNTAVTIYHPTGTCRMGADAASVVDPALKVRGVAGLRVADCAIMPQIVSGNTNAPAIMIGEKCADLVLRDAGP
ncbi:MAG: GMC oxidoreductase, partial [Pseudomonadota bacterium]